jgi:hypothetical protein
MVGLCICSIMTNAQVGRSLIRVPFIAITKEIESRSTVHVVM